MNKDMRYIKPTDSLCPECLKVIPATIYEKEGKVYITKSCPEHGEFTDIYWGDAEQYYRVKEFEDFGVKLDNPQTETVNGCPYDCGLCPEHKSHTVLAIIDVTNRCNLRCPICFAHAGAQGYLYEPSLEQIRGMMKNLLSNRPVKPPALQLSGGEPTVREDLPEIITMAKKMGFLHVEVNSNGIKLAESVDYCRNLKDAGLDTIYLQFDGVTPEPYIQARGVNLFDIKKRALSNMKEAGFRSVVLVPTLVGSVNDDQIGGILDFAVKHKDIVRCVNFQPVSITGRINREERQQMRITIPDLMRLTEEQTDGLVKQGDWYPVPAAVAFTRFLGLLQDTKYVDFSCHPHCGMATYLIIEEDKVEPITKYMDIDQFLEDIVSASGQLLDNKRTRGRITAIKGALKSVNLGMFRRYLIPLIREGSFERLSELHHKMIMIGSMHFMDPYNFDLERVQRCIIHYAIPDGRLIPFCSMNTLHRDKAEKKFSKPLTSNNITPLYPVEELTERIRRENTKKD